MSLKEEEERGERKSARETNTEKGERGCTGEPDIDQSIKGLRKGKRS